MARTPTRYQDHFAHQVFTQFVSGNKSGAVRLVKTAYTKEQTAFLAATVAVMLTSIADDQGGNLASEFVEMLRAKEAQ